MNKASNTFTTTHRNVELATDSANEALDNVRMAIETSANSQPTTTVMMAMAAGFLLGMA